MTEQNPYAPPRAPVTDVGSSTQPPIPQHVETSCQLYWINLGMTLLNSVLTIFTDTKMPSVLTDVFVMLLTVGIGYLIVLWITRQLRAGRNWMRWLLTILKALSLLTLPFIWSLYIQLMAPAMKNPVFAVIALVQWAISIVAVGLLHTPSSRKWFRSGGGSAP